MLQYDKHDPIVIYINLYGQQMTKKCTWDEINTFKEQGKNILKIQA